MTVIRLPNVSKYKDRHGRWRYRFRKKGARTVHLPGEPGSAEFAAALEKARADATPPKGPAIGERKIIPRSFNDLAVSFYSSAQFASYQAETQKTHRFVIERIRAAHGNLPASRMTRADIDAMMARLASKPASANKRLKTLKVLMKYAEAAGFIPKGANPALEVKRLKHRHVGARSWSEEEIAAFLEHHGPGTTPRLALTLLLYTAQRRSDVIRLGRQHVRDGALVFRQQKTGHDMELPILPELATELEHVRNRLTFLETGYGRPFTIAGFGVRMKRWVEAAGLSRLSAHGLRKAAARRLAEAGRSEHEIQSWTGISDPKVLRVYTAAAQQKRLASASGGALSRAESGTTVGEPQIPPLANRNNIK